jgi:hypothetical protein
MPRFLQVTCTVLLASVAVVVGREVGATCGATVVFDSSTSRTEGDIFTGFAQTEGQLSGASLYASNFVCGATELVLSSAVSNFNGDTKARVCTVVIPGPPAPYEAPYMSQSASERATSVLDGTSAAETRSAFWGAVAIPWVSLAVTWMSGAGCSPVIASSRETLELSVRAAQTSSPTNQSEWQVAAQANVLQRFEDVVSPGDWIQTLPTHVGNAAAAPAATVITYAVPTGGGRSAGEWNALVLALPRLGCSARVVVAHRIRVQLVWYVWVFPALATLASGAAMIALSASKESLVRGDGTVRAGRLLALVLAGYTVTMSAAVGLALTLAAEESGLHFATTFPLSEGVSFFICLLTFAFAAQCGCLWRVHDRSLALSLALRLTEQSLFLSLCAAFWYKGSIACAIVTLIVITIAAAVYAAHLSTLASAIPTSTVDFIPSIVSSAVWTPLVLPVAPVLPLYGTLFVATRNGGAMAAVGRAFDATVTLRAVFLTSVPLLVLASLCTAMFPAMLPFLIACIVASMWSVMLGARRVAGLMRMHGLEFGCGWMRLWDAVVAALDAAVAAQEHVSPSRGVERQSAAAMVAQYAAAKERSVAPVEPPANVARGLVRLTSEKADRVASLYTDHDGSTFVAQVPRQVPAPRVAARLQRTALRDEYHDETRRAALQDFQTARQSNASRAKALPESSVYSPRHDDAEFSDAELEPNSRTTSPAARWDAYVRGNERNGAHHHGAITPPDVLQQDALYPDVLTTARPGGQDEHVSPARTAEELVSQRQQALLRRSRQRHPSVPLSAGRSPSAITTAGAVGVVVAGTAPRPVDFADVRYENGGYRRPPPPRIQFS